jgi:hypothetical protein
LERLATPASAQLTAVLKGKVVDEAGKPVEGAEVKGEFLGDVNREFAMKSDKKGGFCAPVFAPGAWKITATKDGLVGTAPRIQLSLAIRTSKLPIALGQPKKACRGQHERKKSKPRTRSRPRWKRTSTPPRPRSTRVISTALSQACRK